MSIRGTRRLISLVLVCLATPASAFATWSVIAVDRATGRVVIASATCVNGDDMFLPGVQAVVVPGKGVAACQSAVDSTHANQMLVFHELQKGTDPKAIVEMLSADPAFQSRQFGIVDLQGRSAGHSGLTNGYVAQDIQGRVPGTEIFYSIQGNILRPGEVVPNAVKAFVETKGLITDRVMAAMEAADAGGGDSRCSCPPPPADGSTPKVPCDGKTAHVAYILLAEKTDTSGDSHNNGSYRMFIRVAQPDHGPLSIHEGENLNPVKTLRLRYDEWRKQQPEALLLGGQGGRGRAAIASIALTTPAWTDGARIPDEYAQPGHDVSPPLAWSNAPDTAASFVLIVHDLDAPAGNGTDDVLHWLVWNIPGAARALAEGVPPGASLPNGARQISVTGPNYRGPAAPPSGPPHHYVFELFALDTMLDVPAAGTPPAQTRAAVLAAMAGHIRGKGVYTGTYRRQS
jgi:Raf kinase inhibitor-like YbhB/YbcL family protein